MPALFATARSCSMRSSRPRSAAILEPAAAELAIVGRQHRGAVGVDAAQIGFEHHLGRGPGVGVRHAPGAKDGHELLTDLLRENSHRSTSVVSLVLDVYRHPDERVNGTWKRAAEYGLVAHTQISRTLFPHLGDPRWHKRRMADALEW